MSEAEGQVRQSRTRRRWLLAMSEIKLGVRHQQADESQFGG